MAKTPSALDGIGASCHIATDNSAAILRWAVHAFVRRALSQRWEIAANHFLEGSQTMTTATKDAASLMPVNTELLAAAVSAAESAFTMCGVTTRCVGASAVPVRDACNVTGLIGVHGKVSGFVSVNFPNRAAVHAVSSLLGEQFTELNSQVVDGVGEITNMITGGIKSALATTQWAFSQITVPSVIVGRGYSIAYAKGLTFLSVTFEHDDKDAMLLEDGLVQISISLLSL